ncbi:MAG: tyrosine-type recombinase/integrase, partial [Fastidiosipila sp.]|nr:tyrosine-type recombinase/integrase [Fastidiosipila sp.]
MPDPEFKSKLGPDIKAFIIQKRAVGYPYLTSAKVLGYLDTMITEFFPESRILSKEICDAWIEKNSKLHQNTLIRRVTPVRQLGKYLTGTGKSAYIVPKGIPSKQLRYDAHIFTQKELKAFFSSIDKCVKSPYSYRCYVIPVIFRWIYTCGLRSSEARLLRVNDVDLTNGKVLIRKSKGWEARIIYVNEDMLDLLCRYEHIISRY